MAERKKIVQISSVLFKADAIGNIIRRLDALHKSKGWESNMAVDLFSEYKGVSVLAGNDYSHEPLISSMSYLIWRFLSLSNKVYWLRSYLAAKHQYKLGMAKDVIEGADIRIWHYGGFYPLFRQFHDGDILCFYGLTPSYLCHASEFITSSKSALYSILDLHPFVIVESEFIKQSLAALGFRNKDIHVLPLFHLYKLDYTIAQHKQPSLIAWGRYALNKGIPELVEECNKAKLPIRVFGDNTQLAEFQAQYKEAMERNAQGYATLSGKVQDFEAELSEANIYICTSLHEGFNMPAIEAMAHSMPVLLRSGTAMDELITNGKEGYLFKKLDEIPNLIEKIMQNYKAMSFHAWQRSQNYMLEKFKVKYFKLLKEYINRQKR